MSQSALLVERLLRRHLEFTAAAGIRQSPHEIKTVGAGPVLNTALHGGWSHPSHLPHRRGWRADRVGCFVASKR